MERANYLIKWTDNEGNLFKQWAVVKGPVERDTDFKANSSADIEVDHGGNKFQMFLGKTEWTNSLRRYDRLILKDPSIGQTRGWIIDVIDDITNKNLVRVDLKEHFIDQVNDNYVEGIAYNYDERSTLSQSDLVTASAQDYVVTKASHGLAQGQALYNTTFEKVFVNYIDVDTFNVTRIINGVPIKLTDNFATATFNYTILINDFSINGSDYIKLGQVFEYDLNINKNINTNLSASNWTINGSGISLGGQYGSVFVTLVNSNMVKVKVAPGSTVGDKIYLRYYNSDIDITKTIQVTSLIS
jgi:hypothetical protein